MWSGDINFDAIILLITGFSVLIHYQFSSQSPSSRDNNIFFEGGEEEENENLDLSNSWYEILLSLFGNSLSTIRYIFADVLVFSADPLNFYENRNRLRNITSIFDWFRELLNLYFLNVSSVLVSTISNFWTVSASFLAYRYYIEKRQNAYNFMQSRLINNRWFNRYNTQYQNMLWRLSQYNISYVQYIIRFTQWINRIIRNIR